MINLDSCGISEITVYGDRAEVSRRVEFSTEGAGVQDIAIKNGSTKIERESIRVSGASGDFTILEVSSSLKTSSSTERPSKPSPIALDLEKRVDDSKVQIDKQELIIKRLEEERRFTSSYMESILSSIRNQKKSSETMSTESASSLISWFRKQAEETETKLLESKQVLKGMQTQFQALSKELQEMESSISGSSSHLNFIEIIVSLHSAKPNIKGALTLTYLITDASWNASYDCRLGSRDSTLQLTYFATVTNSTGENWNDAKIHLSTSLPSFGTEPPSLHTLHATAVNPITATSRQTATLSNTLSNPLYVSSSSSAMLNRLEINDNDLVTPQFNFLAIPPTETSQTRVLTATTERTDISTVFDIQRLATIQSDSKPHKLTIAVITLQSTLSCTTIPVLSPKAYLRAKCKNSSNLPLLQGETHVFIDSNFVGKSLIKQTNTGEELSVFMGVDSSVTIDFKPTRDSSEVSGGLLRRTNTKTVIHKSVIKNTKTVPVDVWVFDQLPLSSDDKVKVHVIEPAEFSPQQQEQQLQQNSIILNDFNNVRWSIHLAPGEEKTIVLRYSIEFPKDKQLVLR